MANAHTTEVKFDRSTKDFCVTVDGDVIGFAASPAEGRQIAANFISDLQAHEDRFVAQAEPVTVEAVAAPVAAGLVNITRENVAQVVARAKEVAAEHTRWQTAISRAESELCKNNWLFTGSVLKIHSRTRKITYVISGNSCTCEAHTRHATPAPCWHIAAWRILIRAAAQPAV